MKVVDIELLVSYDFEGDILELTQSTNDGIPFEFHIIDKDKDSKTGRTTIAFEKIDDLRKTLNDFEKRFNLIKKK